MFSCEYCKSFKSKFFYRPTLVAPCEVLYWIPKRNDSVMKRLEYSFPVEFAFNMLIQCSERTTQPETICVHFLVVMIHQNLLSFSMMIKFNFGLNFHTVRLFYLNCKISFGFLPIKEKSLGLLKRSLKCKK